VAARERSTTRIVAALAAVATALTIYQLTRPGLLFGVTPDVSVYLGAAVRLVHGAVPYRDFVFVQPPGFVVLGTPFALLSEVTGTRNALAVLRLLTPLLAAADVVMVGRLARGHGWAATLVACAVAALFPAELYAIRGPQLEPVVITLCLLGAVLVFAGDAPAGPRRVALGGVAFGLAVAVKLTALLPLAVLGLLCSAQLRRRLLPLAGGAVAGFGVPTVPFFLLAPGAFLRDTVATAVGRVPASGRVPLPPRVGDLTGFAVFGASDAVTLALGIAIALLVALAFALPRRRPTMFEWFVLGSSAVVGVAQLVPALYYPQYAALMAPFLALTLGVAVSRLHEARPGRLPLVPVGAALLALLVAQVAHVSSESVPDVAAAVDAVVPAGACAISDSPVYLFTSDRFQGASPRCPTLTDAEGTTLALGGTSPTAASAWRRAFAGADYIVTADPIIDWTLPASADLPGYVAANFTPVHSGGLLIYVRHRPG
jgi:alpha-1,2-mannosyltransferase